MTSEIKRLEEDRRKTAAWKKWGPYLSERQWGTVREDYSADGNAWDYFNHDQARSRAYRWGEDGLGGISDDRQLLCFCLALWNGRDAFLKERLFGLTNSQGNHGEDVKEYYFYLDSTPTHSFMRFLYKYPQAAYPYDELVEANRRRTRHELEYELLDTGIFDDDRYFDCFVEYAKAGPEDVLITVTVANRGPEDATLHVLPTLWFRNTWSWGDGGERPALRRAPRTGAPAAIEAAHPVLGTRYLYCEGAPDLLFTENETNNERLFGTPNASPFVKDGIHRRVVDGETGAVNPAMTGTKAAAHHVLAVPAGQSRTLRLRLCDASPEKMARPFGASFDRMMAQRQSDADAFYAHLTPAKLDEDQARVFRQALAGMLWTKQFYHYDVNKWLDERGCRLAHPGAQSSRNEHWHHMYNADIISMPDKWEYPWYAAWDLAFHMQALTLVDPDFSKQQLALMLREHYMHPNGQIPAYEWNFGDVNPPVHAWATNYIHRLEKASGRADMQWLERSFQKLLLNFTWWVNRKDRNGRNLFEGGFLGLDNIGVFDRSAPLPTGGYLEQADGTAWMTLFCLNMLDISFELARHHDSYADMALKFMQHSLWIASSMFQGGEEECMWDEKDGFFYDVLRYPDGRAQRLQVRSVVGLLPMCAVATFDGELLQRFPEIIERYRHFNAARPELMAAVHDSRVPGVGGRHLASVLNEDKLRRVLAKVLDEDEFLGAYGIRSLSLYHEAHPYVFAAGGQTYRVDYQPAESDSGMFGGNSNWRGPIWAPINALVIRALLQYYSYYGESFQIECPTGSGRLMSLYRIAEEISRRNNAIFLRGPDGRRPVFGGTEKFQTDPHWRDYILFYEYFHGDNGAGLGASHQTGWTGIVARGMHLFATLAPEDLLGEGKTVR